MKKLILLFLVFAVPLMAQDSRNVGRSEINVNENGVIKRKMIFTPEINNGYNTPQVFNQGNNVSPINNSAIRWIFQDPASVGTFSTISGNGFYSITGWDLNSPRISLFDTNSATPLWDYTADPNVFLNYIDASASGRIAGGSYHSILIFDNTSSTPVFNFNTETLADTGIAGPVAITGSGSFLVGCASRSDSSTIFGFNSTSTTPVWSFRIVPTVLAGGGDIQGIRMSANDSLTIVNTYSELFVFRTYTGQMIFTTRINPTSTSGTQSSCAISGDGSLIANGNYSGFVRVHKWNGSTYAFQWQHQEPPGQFFNWMTTVDITNDGQYVACGTLNFVSSSSFDGKVKVFRSTSSTPMWVYAGMGDEVNAVSFSQSGNVLAAASWGPIDNISDDLLIFKTYQGNVPIYAVNSPGSLFSCKTSDDGTTVVASGKAVHARLLGSGGIMYNLRIDTNDMPSGVINNGTEIAGYSLSQNYPNPFNPSTSIEFTLLKNSNVRLTVYDAMGKEVMVITDRPFEQGTHSVSFDGTDIASGLYFYKMEADGYIETRKMLLIK